MKEIVISDELQNFFNKENEPLKELAKEYDTLINNAKDKEIERLNKELEEYKKDFKEANDLALKLITNNQEYVCKSIKDTIDILIEKLQQKENIIKEVRELCEKQFVIYEVNSLGGKIKRYAPISTDKIMEILDKENK